MVSENLHWAVADVSGRSFLLYNAREDYPFTSETIENEDLERIAIQPGSRFASETWSCGYEYYFIVCDAGIMLLNVFSNDGFLCKKKSIKFIEMFLDAPRKAPKSRKAMDGPAASKDN
jgi:hypothetical protein